MGFPLGQPVRIPVTIQDTTPGSGTFGTLQDPGTLTLLLQAPEQAVQTLTYPANITRDSQGTYHYDVTPQIPGRWAFRWVATGAFAGATTEQWFVVDSSDIG